MNRRDFLKSCAMIPAAVAGVASVAQDNVVMEYIPIQTFPQYHARNAMSDIARRWNLTEYRTPYGSLYGWRNQI